MRNNQQIPGRNVRSLTGQGAGAAGVHGRMIPFDRMAALPLTEPHSKLICIPIPHSRAHAGDRLGRLKVQGSHHDRYLQRAEISDHHRSERSNGPAGCCLPSHGAYLATLGGVGKTRFCVLLGGALPISDSSFHLARGICQCSPGGSASTHDPPRYISSPSIVPPAFVAPGWPISRGATIAGNVDNTGRRANRTIAPFFATASRKGQLPHRKFRIQCDN